MTITKTLALPALTMGLLLAASAVLAQEVTFDQIDGSVEGTTPDGVLDQAELEKFFTPEEVATLLAKDADDNGLTAEELTAGEEGTDGEEPAGEPVEGGEGEPADDGDGNHGHGNSPNGFDIDNPGRGHGTDGRPGNSPDRGNRGGNKHGSDEG